MRWPRLLPLGLLLVACGSEGGSPDAPDRAARAGGGGAASGESAAAAAGVPLAVTIDDLPWVGPLPPGADRAEATRRLLANLRAHDVQATGFVNCERVASGAPVLRQWLEAGQQLGNHTAAHADLNRAPLDRWLEGARSCDAYLRELTGRSNLFFRYPYLHQGPTRERQQAALETLDELGSPIAHVSIDAGEWLLDDAYVAALAAGDSARAETIAREYVEHVVRAAEHYRSYARERFGRDIAQVLLLHANALAADRLDELLGALERAGFRFVPLADALEDPVYALPDEYTGPDGLSWLYRAEPADPGAKAWDDGEQARLRELADG